jgi:hypothetical protein
MKQVDYLYFNIYRYFYKVSQVRQTFNPRIQALYLFTLGSGGWLLLLEAIYVRLIRGTRFASHGESFVFSLTVYLVSLALANYIFISKERDLKIFEAFGASDAPVRKKHQLFSFTVLLAPYLLIVVFGMVFSRHLQA